MECRKSWTQHAPAERISGGLYAIFLPELLLLRIIAQYSPFQTQVINVGLKLEAISKGNFTLDFFGKKKVFFNWLLSPYGDQFIKLISILLEGGMTNSFQKVLISKTFVLFATLPNFTAHKTVRCLNSIQRSLWPY
jgi:hypothetical protein